MLEKESTKPVFWPISGLNRLYSTYENLKKLHNQYYSKLEAKVLFNEESERYRIKKSILLYHSYLIIVFFLIIPLLNPSASLIKSFIHIVSAFIQIFILRGKNYELIGSYVYIHAFMSVICQYFTEGEPFAIIGLVLANQHMFFLFPESQILSKIYIPVVILMISSMQKQLLDSFNGWDNKFEINVKSLNYSWPALFLFHHLGAKNLTTSYRLALIDNMEIQKELKGTLKLLKKTNEELKEALQSRELFIASGTLSFYCWI